MLCATISNWEETEDPEKMWSTKLTSKDRKHKWTQSIKETNGVAKVLPTGKLPSPDNWYFGDEYNQTFKVEIILPNINSTQIEEKMEHFPINFMNLAWLWY